MANNIHKKLTFEDKFARHYYCEHARLNQLREDKKRQKRVIRNLNKKMIRKETEDYE